MQYTFKTEEGPPLAYRSAAGRVVLKVVTTICTQCNDHCIITFLQDHWAHVCGQVCQKKRSSRTFQEKNRILPGHNGVHPSASPHYMVVFLALELLHIQKQGCTSRSDLATFSPCQDPQENKKIA